MRGVVMDGLANNSKDWHGDLVQAIWRRRAGCSCFCFCFCFCCCTSLLLLLSITSIPTVAAADPYQFPASNLNDSIFFYSNDVGDFILRKSTIINCNNGSLLQALSTQDRLHGRAANILSGHILFDYTVFFELFFVISADDLCSTATPSYYLSLVAFKSFGKAAQDTNKGKVVWTANVGNPVGGNTCLHLSPDDSNLRLVDYDRNGSVVWETNTPGYTNATLTITFEGNLVLYTNVSTDPSDSTTLKQKILWQSYEQPTDTLMVLEALRPGMNLTAASTTESTNKTAIYTLAIDKNGTLALYTKIQYKASDNNTSNSTTDDGGYGHPYLVWSVNGTQEMNRSYDHAAAVLCWYPDHRSSLQLDIVPSAIDGSDVISNYNQISPDECSRRGKQSAAIIFEDSDSHGDSFNITFATFLRLESDGDLHAYTLNDTRYPDSTAVWTEFANLSGSGSINPCQLPLFCGFYGVCDKEKQNCSPDCGGSNELVLQDSNKDSKLGCKFKAGYEEPYPASSCGHGSNLLGGSMIAGASYFSNAFLPPDHTGIEAQDCWENHCLDNCACTAAFWESKLNGSCFLVQGPVATIIFNASATKEFIGYLKFIVVPDTSSPSTPLLTKPIAIGVSLGVFVLIIAMFVCGVYVHRRRRLQARRLEDYEIEKELLGDSLLGAKPRRFTWKEMHEYTCGFSDALGGGGFGNVFRGTMDDGTPIAVKQLIDGGHQGNKEFIAEVSILGRTHHLQLVHLVGFCLEGATHKLLVYELMENGSLDAWIFSKTPNFTPESEEIKAEKPRRILSWERRFDIALGTAKGLAYLHEECEDRIIHMDLKPQNILLGADFFPKISDFGMSRRVLRDEQSAVVTIMRGTPGYLAPEWLTDGAITEKCDVFSYGIVLLEIVSGRKVRDWRALRKRMEMRSNPGEGVMELVDERLINYGMGGVKIYDEEQALRMVEVAMLCVQTDPRSRPSMSSVVQMLEGKVDVIPQAPIDYYQQMELFPSERMRGDGLEELKLEQYKHQWSLNGEPWRSGSTSTSTMMSKSRKSFSSGKVSYNYTEISTSDEYIDSLDLSDDTYKKK